MADEEDVKEAAAALVRKNRERNEKLLAEIKRDGWESPEDVLRDIGEVESQVALDGRKVPRSHRGVFGGRRKPQRGMENVNAGDVLPSRHRVEKLVDYLKEIIKKVKD